MTKHKMHEHSTFRDNNNNSKNPYTGSPHHDGDIQWGPVGDGDGLV